MKKIIILMIATTLFLSGNSHCAKQEHSNKENLVEIVPSDFQPTFTKHTVIKLNAIVSRSLEVINEYDKIINDVRERAESQPKTSEEKMLVEKEVARIADLSVRSKLVLDELLKAEKALKASGEVYNRTIFAGMMIFVENVEQEISEQSDALLTKLKQA